MCSILRPNCNYELPRGNTNKKQDAAAQFSYFETLDNDINMRLRRFR
ncbi:hypothetical protein PF005_g23641 [Phytophthora fragariae]|uniref:Uncharacterized protein n=1 Tax=Phytophthora fragariae TaxID=53985 RepID=A0A6A3VYA7_9STRA|nr:hypothetical protein PF009_g24397 [Phytophthora fragariae]KAE9000330.1 hypothetical protein PF011_g14230 [Phytophthora fragariae]KAE9066606.1 hypothetical protein PF007_g28384 [Phytophthora fragariae]KAE9174611.1 hypothetical protein PF002_g28995 [Phytophthora fragariae]KAE9179552.1 hypothetical protein PF005_g23641 [Phytophthora fragariae]